MLWTTRLSRCSEPSQAENSIVRWSGHPSSSSYQIAAMIAQVSTLETGERLLLTSFSSFTLRRCSFTPLPSPKAASARPDGEYKHQYNIRSGITLDSLVFVSWSFSILYSVKVSEPASTTENDPNAYRSSIVSRTTIRLMCTSFSCPSRCTRSYACAAVA